MTRRTTNARVNAGHRTLARRLVREYVGSASDGHIGMSPAELADLRAKVEAMTPWPWEAGGVARTSSTFDDEANVFPPLGESGPIAVVRAAYGDERSPDCDAIVALRNAAPRLLATVEQQAKRIAELEAGLREATKDGCGFVFGGRPPGWTCLDNQKSARADLARIASGEPRIPGEMYSLEYGERLSSGADLCLSCRIRALLAPKEG